MPFFSTVLKYAEETGMSEKIAQVMEEAVRNFSEKGQIIGNFGDFGDQ